jgi:RNA polymerase subunit RPABC4/transcription elongation factor Spt4
MPSTNHKAKDRHEGLSRCRDCRETFVPNGGHYCPECHEVRFPEREVEDLVQIIERSHRSGILHDELP